MVKGRGKEEIKYQDRGLSHISKSYIMVKGYCPLRVDTGPLKIFTGEGQGSTWVSGYADDNPFWYVRSRSRFYLAFRVCRPRPTMAFLQVKVLLEVQSM